MNKSWVVCLVGPRGVSTYAQTYAAHKADKRALKKEYIPVPANPIQKAFQHTAVLCKEYQYHY